MRRALTALVVLSACVAHGPNLRGATSTSAPLTQSPDSPVVAASALRLDRGAVKYRVVRTLSLSSADVVGARSIDSAIVQWPVTTLTGAPVIEVRAAVGVIAQAAVSNPGNIEAWPLTDPLPTGNLTAGTTATIDVTALARQHVGDSVTLVFTFVSSDTTTATLASDSAFALGNDTDSATFAEPTLTTQVTACTLGCSGNAADCASLDQATCGEVGARCNWVTTGVCTGAFSATCEQLPAASCPPNAAVGQVAAQCAANDATCTGAIQCTAFSDEPSCSAGTACVWRDAHCSHPTACPTSGSCASVAGCVAGTNQCVNKAPPIACATAYANGAGCDTQQCATSCIPTNEGGTCSTLGTSGACGGRQGCTWADCGGNYCPGYTSCDNLHDQKTCELNKCPKGGTRTVCGNIRGKTSAAVAAVCKDDCGSAPVAFCGAGKATDAECAKFTVAKCPATECAVTWACSDPSRIHYGTCAAGKDPGCEYTCSNDCPQTAAATCRDSTVCTLAPDVLHCYNVVDASNTTQLRAYCKKVCGTDQITDKPGCYATTETVQSGATLINCEAITVQDDCKKSTANCAWGYACRERPDVSVGACDPKNEPYCDGACINKVRQIFQCAQSDGSCLPASAGCGTVACDDGKGYCGKGAKCTQPGCSGTAPGCAVGAAPSFANNCANNDPYCTWAGSCTGTVDCTTLAANAPGSDACSQDAAYCNEPAAACTVSGCTGAADCQVADGCHLDDAKCVPNPDQRCENFSSDGAYCQGVGCTFSGATCGVTTGGHEPSCGDATTEVACDVDNGNGCSWADSGCVKLADLACASVTDKTACNAQPGCGWGDACDPGTAPVLSAPSAATPLPTDTTVTVSVSYTSAPGLAPQVDGPTLILSQGSTTLSTWLTQAAAGGVADFTTPIAFVAVVPVSKVSGTVHYCFSAKDSRGRDAVPVCGDVQFPSAVAGLGNASYAGGGLAGCKSSATPETLLAPLLSLLFMLVRRKKHGR